MTATRIDLDTIRLDSGSHAGPDQGFCVMELVAYLAREPWSDRPACTSPIIGAFLRHWNDALDDETRQRLKPYAQRVIGTHTGPTDEETRAWVIADWLVRVHTPAWLELAGLQDQAAQLRALPALTSSEIAVAVQSVIDEARSQAAAAWAAAWDAARAAAMAAARDAAWDAARAAAWDAARDVARDVRPTERHLQERALELLDRLIAVSKPEQQSA